MIYYLSTFYTRQELASRIGLFYAALVGSSAFGGLLAYGMFQIKNETYFQWSYLFFLEGSLGLFWAIITYLILPQKIQTAWFLNHEEKRIAIYRLEQDSVTTMDTKFSWSESFSEFRGPHGWIRIIIAFVGGTVLASNANFLAIIVKRLGFTVIKTNLVSFSLLCQRISLTRNLVYSRSCSDRCCCPCYLV